MLVWEKKAGFVQAVPDMGADDMLEYFAWYACEINASVVRLHFTFGTPSNGDTFWILPVLHYFKNI